MSQTYISLQFEKINKRLNEIQTLLQLAKNYQQDNNIYVALCRSAHVLLVSHFEGLYKDICKDVISDINSNLKFSEVRKDIFNTYCNYFIQKDESSHSAHGIRLRLKEAFEMHPAQIKYEPFLFVDNKNPAPDIIEAILGKFGVKDFFWSIADSDLDLVFKNQKSDTRRLRNRILNHTKRNVENYPYTVNSEFYHPIKKSKKNAPTLWKDFLNNLLKGRHDIVHGHVIDNPISHDELYDASIRIEILIMAFIINICESANPIFLLPE